MQFSFFDNSSLESLTYSSLILVIGVMLFFLFWGWRSTKKKNEILSPYTGNPVRRFDSLSYESIEKVKEFMERQAGYDNRMFNIHRAVVCRDTGRIFPNAITWYGKMELDWTFLQKRHLGDYVSWGSLTKETQREIQNLHDSLEEFQTELSSTVPSPRIIEKSLAYLKPGPLYVNPDTNELLGWKCIPDSELEVLIVQKPKDKSPFPAYLKDEKEKKKFKKDRK